ncbi:FAD/NAD(P)-binding protein [Streptomyces spiramyceticus]|uniref:FAD/NAD(P)-binding protein n=1 Tax=Streptomyces spiramyceticus TaxID=299717 RepID=UPI00237BD4C6|nr:FAD/NAD(P)-binding protein [Streptomyces spiramyceticus]
MSRTLRFQRPTAPGVTVLSAVRHALAVVGAGPRGTSVLERLCASVPALTPDVRLTVHVVDPAPPGAGRVWRTEQPADLLMNTVASQVTLFTDESVDCAGPIRPGPSLYEWATAPTRTNATTTDTALGPDDYPTRACYGRYLEWVFRQVVCGAPESVTVQVHSARAVRLQDAPDGTQSLALDNGLTLTGLSAVVLAQGHLPVHPGKSESHLTAYAARHGLRHLPPANPADLDLSALAPGEPVLLRGLGLNFFDHMALLTSGRGGTFTRGSDGTLTYHPSGREPRLYAGSRRGVPHQARGDNAKGPYGRHTPLLLTPTTIAAFRARADAGDPPDFLAEIWPLVAKEVETVYYETLQATRLRTTATTAFRERFLATAHHSPEEAAVLDAFGIPHQERWCWNLTARPYTGRTFHNPADHRAWLLHHLRRDAAHAALGNVAGPRKAALDVLRDLRNELRRIVDHAGLPGASRRNHLDRWYTPLNAFLSIGPPRRRIEEMTALIEAGVLDVVGPRMTVGTVDGAFVASSPDVPGSEITATTLVEARLPEPDLRRTSDELLASLLKTGQCRPHTVDGYETGGLDVTRRPYRLIDHRGEAHPHRFAFGVPTEGVHWVTAAGARPGVDSVTLTDADAVARAALRATTAVRTTELLTSSRP